MKVTLTLVVKATVPGKAYIQICGFPDELKGWHLNHSRLPWVAPSGRAYRSSLWASDEGLTIFLPGSSDGTASDSGWFSHKTLTGLLDDIPWLNKTLTEVLATLGTNRTESAPDGGAT